MTSAEAGRGSGSVLLPSVAVLLVIAAISTVPTRDSWALALQQCVSADGHVYLIVTTLTASIGTQVTSVAMTQGTASACVNQAKPMSPVVSAFAGSLGRPLEDRMRTTVLSGFNTNIVSCQNNFDPDGADGKGILLLPSPQSRTVSVDPAFSSEALLPVEEADSSVPAAMDLRRVVRPRMRCRGDTMAFPLGGNSPRISNERNGEVEDQVITFDDTKGTRVGNAESQETPDGFLLQGNCTSMSTCQIIVFVGYLGPDCSLGSSASAAGFSVDGNLTTDGAEGVMVTGGNRDCSGSSP